MLTPGTLLLAGGLIAILAASTRWIPRSSPLLYSLAIGTAIVVGITYRQLAAPDDLRSSVNVIGRMIAWGGQPFGAATGAAIAATTDVPTAFIVASAITLISGIGAAIASERDDRQISRRGVTRRDLAGSCRAQVRDHGNQEAAEKARRPSCWPTISTSFTSASATSSDGTSNHTKLGANVRRTWHPACW